MSKRHISDSAFKNINIYTSIGRGYGLFYHHSNWKGELSAPATYLYYVEDGEFILTVEDKNYVVRPHQLVIIPRNKHYTYYSAKSISVWFYSFDAEVEDKDFFEFYGFDTDSYVVDVENPEEISMLLNNLFHTTDYDSELSIRLNSAAMTIDIISMYVDMRIKKAAADTFEFEPVINYMKENLGEKINLPELASMMDMELTYFVKKFKKKVGLSPLKYYDDLKINKSINLLLNSDLPVNKIGNCLGFKNPLYFSQFFKKHIGVSPLEYRKLFKK